MFSRTRMQVSWSDSESHSALEAPTIRVLDAFTRGGAQRAGGQHTRAVTAASDLDYVRGIHSYRAGLEFNYLRVRADDTTNYLGTYTFESPEAFEAGAPAQLHAARRRPEHPLQQPAGRRRTSRTTCGCGAT